MCWVIQSCRISEVAMYEYCYSGPHISWIQHVKKRAIGYSYSHAVSGIYIMLEYIH